MHTYAEYIKAWKTREIIEIKRLKVEQQKAIKKAFAAAKFLAEKYKVNKVILFGSLLKKEYRTGSDIDLAVSGLPVKSFLKAWVETEELIDAMVDMKLIEECSGLILKRINGGMVIYEKKS